MSTVTAPAEAPPPVERPSAARSARAKLFRWRRHFVIAAMILLALVGGVQLGRRIFKAISATGKVEIPTARVVRGDVSLAVTSKGELRGGNPEMLTAPLTGGQDMHVTILPKNGQAVKAGDVVLGFDTTEQEFKLKEAEGDLAEAEQHLIQVKAQREADEEEDRYQLLKAQSDLKLSELEARRNPIVPAITARQNIIGVEAARDHLAQLQQNQANRKATSEAALAMQEAGRGKAESQATTARKNIEAMTLRAHRSGYISIHQNMSGNFFFTGMVLPLYQIGDTVRPGMAVAEIPDLQNWEIGANIGELDRGHLAVGEKVAITIIAVPNIPFAGKVKEMGGTTGPPWDRRFECKISLDNPSPELRPGMSARIVVTTDQLNAVLSLPAQALFENDGRKFVYVQQGGSYTPKDVKLVRRNETRVVIEGLSEGQVVALANPADVQKEKAHSSSATQSLHK